MVIPADEVFKYRARDAFGTPVFGAYRYGDTLFTMIRESCVDHVRTNRSGEENDPCDAIDGILDVSERRRSRMWHQKERRTFLPVPDTREIHTRQTFRMEGYIHRLLLVEGMKEQTKRAPHGALGLVPLRAALTTNDPDGCRGHGD